MAIMNDHEIPEEDNHNFFILLLSFTNGTCFFLAS